MVRDENNILDKKLLTGLTVLLIVISVLYCVLLFTTGLRVVNDFSCNAVHVTDFEGKETTNGYVLDNAGEYALQYFEVENSKNALRFKFCFETNVTSNKGGVKAGIINQNETVLKDFFLLEGVRESCVVFRDGIVDENYLGISCLDCDANNNIILRSELAGDDVIQVYNNGINRVYLNDTMNLQLNVEKSCKENFRTWTKLYLWIALSVVFMSLILLGWDKLRENLFNWFLEK